MTPAVIVRQGTVECGPASAAGLVERFTVRRDETHHAYRVWDGRRSAWAPGPWFADPRVAQAVAATHNQQSPTAGS